MARIMPRHAIYGFKISIESIDQNQYQFLGQKYAFKVCRIEPENNLDIILEAFSVQEAMPIVVVGNWSNSNYGLSLRKKYQEFQHMYLLDPIYDQTKIDALRGNCHVYVHGHSAGGTNPSLVEAMFLGLPIIAFDVSYNRETTHNASLYFKDVNQLSNLIKDIDAVDLANLSKSMKQIADKEYTWSTIAKKYANLF